MWGLIGALLLAVGVLVLVALRYAHRAAAPKVVTVPNTLLAEAQQADADKTRVDREFTRMINAAGWQLRPDNINTPPKVWPVAPAPRTAVDDDEAVA